MGLSRVVLAVLVLVGGCTGASAQTWTDTAITRMVEAMLASLPNDVKVSYDSLKTDYRARTFEVSGLKVVRDAHDVQGSGSLQRLRATGVDVMAALSGKPFTADRIEMTRLKVIEAPRRGAKAKKGNTYSAGSIAIDDARMPSFIALARQGTDQPLGGVTFGRATIDGTPVHDTAQALNRLRRKRW